MVDLKGSLGSLKRTNELYEDKENVDVIAWAGQVAVHREQPIPLNSFLKDLNAPLEILVRDFLTDRDLTIKG